MAESLSVGNLSTSGGLTRLTGTGSKLDTEALVNAAYQAKRSPAVRLEQKITKNEAKIGALNELKSLLGDLKGALNGLRHPPGLTGVRDNLFEAKDAYISSNTTTPPNSLLGVNLDNTAQAGGFEIVVERLATANKLQARTVGGEQQTLAEGWNGSAAFSGNLEVGLAGGAKATVAVTGAMDILDLKDAINGVSGTTGVSASIVKVSGSDYRLVLSGKETGKAIELADAGGAGITAMLGTTEIQAARTARIQVDGVAIERNTNKIDDVMRGVTLDLYKAEPGTKLSVSVEPELAAVKEGITGFVDAYNALRDFVDQHAALDETGGVAEGAVLFGDRTLRSVAQSLGGLVGGSVAGLPAGALATLRDVGITLGADNHLQVDQGTLDNKLLAKLDEVRKVFEFSATSSSTELSVYGRTNALADTAFRVAISDPEGDGVPNAATIDGHAAEVSGGMIKGAAGSPYEGLELMWIGKGDAAIDVTVSQGVADRLYNTLEEALDSVDGPLQKAIEDLGESNKTYQTQITRIDERADAERARLIEKFTAMESALSLANSMLTQVRAQMDAMNAEN